MHNTIMPAPKTATMATSAPTRRQYDNLQRAFDLFNAELFDGKLRPVLITLQRQANTRGYFWPEQFKRKHQAQADAPAYIDEIALNPDAFERPDCEILSTLAHEMVHLWQQQYGDPGRGRYHNKEWAAKMKAVGLQPTDTGLPRGKETGDHITHIIVPNGPFERACKQFLESDAAIDWHAMSGRLTMPAKPKSKPDPGDDAGDDAGDDRQAPAKKQTRAKFTCPDCGLNAWAKPGARLLCADCTDMDAGQAVELEECTQ